MIAAYWLCLCLALTWAAASRLPPDGPEVPAPRVPAAWSALAAFGISGLVAATLAGSGSMLHLVVAGVAALAAFATGRAP